MCIWCSAEVLFDCIQVLGRQQVRKGSSAKCEPWEQTARYWVGQSKQEYTGGRRSIKRFSLTLDWGHEGRIREVLQEDGRSGMHRDIVVQLSVWKELAWISDVLLMCCHDYLVTYYLCITIIILYSRIKLNTDCCLFTQVKNKPWLPWVYSWIWHRREQLPSSMYFWVLQGYHNLLLDITRLPPLTPG
jgi:hypothetical protein